jgi:excisionase family DNA binding protein
MNEVSPPLTVEELAKRWQCTREAIYILLKRKVNPLPAFRVGGKLWRIRADDVLRWEKGGENTRSDDITSSSSRAKPSSSGEAKTENVTDIGSASSRKEKAESRLIASLAASKR